MNSDFEMKGISVPTVDISMKAKMDEGDLHLETEIAGRIQREVVHFKAEACRKALIRLGWIPPEQQMGFGEAISVIWKRLRG